MKTPTVFDVGIAGISIVGANGNATDIQYMVETLSIYENIVTPIVYGEIKVLDGVNLIDKLPITGFDFILIDIKTAAAEKPIRKTFRIFDLYHREKVSNSAQVYHISFCSEELFVASQYLVSKAFKGKQISEIIKDICINNLKIKEDRLAIEETKGLYDFVIPYMKPLEAINFVARKALTKSNHPSFVFYETLLDGFKFVSIETLFKKNPVASYKETIKKIDPSELDPFAIMKAEVERSFNTLLSQQSGKFASNLQTIDLLRRKVDTIQFDLNEFFSKTVHLEQIGSVSKMLLSGNRKKDLPNRTPDSHSRFVFTNLDQSQSPYIKEKIPDIKNTNVELTDLQRNSFFQNFLDMNTKIFVPGNTTLKCGDIIEVTFQSPEMQIYQHIKKEKSTSGKYIICKLSHDMVDRKLTTTLWLVKDDTKNTNYVASKNSSVLDIIKGF